MATLDLNNAHPGDVVVPLSDMLDLLSSRLDASELEALSSELILRRTSEVRAGDLITAELMNQILADVANLQARLMLLEEGIPSQSSPQIVLVNPNNGVMIGSQLQVSGFNLAPDQLTSVRMGGRPVTVFSTASHSKLLAFDVPPILGIPPEGAEVNLVITNAFGSDDIMVEVLRSQATELSVDITMLYTNIPTETLEPNTEYTFTVSISALTSMASQYILIPNIDNPDWSTRLVSSSNRITIPTSQPTPFEFDVDVIVTTGDSGSAEFYLRIEADGQSEQFGESSPLSLEIDEVTEVNTEISFGTVEISPSNIDAATGNLQLVAGGNVVFRVNAIFGAVGNYTVSTPQIINNTSNRWSAQLLSPQNPVADAVGEIHQNFIRLQLAAGAPLTTPIAQIRFEVARIGSTEPPAEFIRSLQVRA
jgi:hypothetical protein